MVRNIMISIVVIMAIGFCQSAYKAGGEVRFSPRLLNYQGYLTDTLGNPITNPTVSMTFTIFDAVSAGNSKWTETQPTVGVDKGIFHVLLGSVAIIPDSVFNNPDRWLELSVVGQTLTPRTRIVSSPYAYTATYSDSAQYSRVSAPDNDWTFLVTDGADTTLQTGGRWGLARLGNTLFGNADSTHVNLGVACTTGISGQNYKYCTIAGGYHNIAVGSSATVGGGAGNIASYYNTTIGGGLYNVASGANAVIGGGVYNRAFGLFATIGGGEGDTVTGAYGTVGGGNTNKASSNYTTIGGGSHNLASDYAATISGGSNNMANGYVAVIGGGLDNTVLASCAAIVGGYANTIAETGDYSYLFGINSNLTQDSTFMVDMPHVWFGTEANGYEFPRARGTNGQVMVTNGTGQLSWNNAPADNDWTYRVSDGADTTLQTGGRWGLARLGNTLFGNADSTHVNFGVACTTGISGQNNKYCTVAGGNDNNAGHFSATVGGGSGNNASDASATIGGGSLNMASGYTATVGGGGMNTASGNWATVGGGGENVSSGPFASVCGGVYDTAKAIYCSVLGGYSNLAGDVVDDTAAVVVGGYNNSSTGKYAFVGGGKNHLASSSWSTISGGDADTASGSYATVGGGQSNKANGTGAVVSGGYRNIATYNYATVAGGAYNNADTVYASVGGGEDNDATASHATVAGGGFSNAIATYATVGGGGWNNANQLYSLVSGGRSNTADSFYSTVGGGRSNYAKGIYATVSGGYYNFANSDYATVAGGYADTAYGMYSTIAGGNGSRANGNYSTVAGGQRNQAYDNHTTIGGGNSNYVNGLYSTIGGGSNNVATGFSVTIAGGEGDSATGYYSAIPGGYHNTATGRFGFAAGRQAKSLHSGAFVWADSTNANFLSTGPNQFLARASGGVYLYTNSGLTSGMYLAAGGSSWNAVSDRNMKENFKLVDGQAVLDKLAEMPIMTWNYKSQDISIRHVGPMAQDFAEFGVGESDKHINMLDADGIALAAIQELAKKLERLESENKELRQEIQLLKNR